MTDQPTQPVADPQPPEARPPVGASRFIPVILMTGALILVLAAGIVSRRAADEGRAVELGITQTVQSVIDAATGTAQAIGSRTPQATLTLTPTGTP